MQDEGEVTGFDPLLCEPAGTHEHQAGGVKPARPDGLEPGVKDGRREAGLDERQGVPPERLGGGGKLIHGREKV